MRSIHIGSPAVGGIVLEQALAGAPARTVFLSHSAGADPFAAQVRDLLTRRLRERGYQVLVDTDGLVPGTDWGPELFRWLGQCDAAVILLSAKALRSPWVQRETHILLWRRALNPAFLVVPALLAVSAEQVEEAGLDELAPVQAARCDGVSEKDGMDLVDRVLRVLPPTLPELPDDAMRRWLRDISAALNSIPPLSRDVLREAGRHLDLPDRPPFEWTHEEAGRAVAAQMLGQGLRDRRLERALTAVSRILDVGPFGRLSRDSLPSWVDAGAARLVLPPQAGSEPERMAVFLDLTSTDLAEDYIARAMCREIDSYECWAVTTLPSGESPAEEILESCRVKIREELSLDDDEPLGPDTVRPEDKVHYLVLHPGEAPPEAVVAAAAVLHRECPWLVLVLLGADGRITPDMIAGAGIRGAVPVEPSLTRDEEKKAKQLRRAVEKIMQKRYGRLESPQ